MNFKHVGGTLGWKGGVWREDGSFIFSVVKCVSHSVTPDTLRPCGLQPARLSQNHGVLQRSLGWIVLIASRDPSGPDRTLGLRTAGRFFYCLSQQGSLSRGKM